jgi:uncharacterized protein (DUF4415 family)
MASRKRLQILPDKEALIDEDGEVREVTAEDVAHFKPFSVLPETEQRVLLRLGRRGPQKTPKKVPISIRLSPDVAEGLRAIGAGWQGRADEALRSWLASKGPLQRRAPEVKASASRLSGASASSRL